MGFDINGVRLLLKAKELEVDFSKVLTIGRQGLHLQEKEMKNLLISAGFTSDDSLEIFSESNYAEGFLKLLGANITDALDASDYEKASVIHDLNTPIPADLKSKYSLVIDGGSLEHVFNFPVAIKSCMELIQRNGYYIGITPTNNFTGHGFYQFSPELYYRIFSRSNGFRIIKMYFYITRKGTSIYEVLDPSDVSQRITMVNSFPSYLFIIAQKSEDKEVFSQMPQQSDYEQIIWKEKAYGDSANNGKMMKFIKGLLPVFLRGKLWRLKKVFYILYRYTRPTGISNPRFIKKVHETIPNR